jgi:hypothetical protein
MAVNFTGTWKANLAESRFVGPAPQAILVKIEHADPRLRQEMSFTRADGKADRLVFHCWTNGEPDKALLNGKPVHGAARWEENELVIELSVSMGSATVHLRDCWSLSADGNRLCMEHRDDALAGQFTVLIRAE